jgi:hypothetical protein
MGTDDTTVISDSAPEVATKNANASPATEAQDRLASPALKSLVDKISGPDEADTDADNSTSTTLKEDPPAKPTDEKKPAAEPEEDPDPTPEEVKTFTPNVQKRIEQLARKRRAAEERANQLALKAKMVDDLDQQLSTHKIERAVWDQWQQLGFLAQTDPKSAAKVLAHMAKNLAPEVVAELTERAAKAPEAQATALDDDLQKMVDDFEISPEVATKLQARRAPPKTEATNGEPKAPPRVPIPTMSDMDIRAGEEAIKAVDAEFRQKYPRDWEKLAPKVNQMLTEYRGIAPSKWGKIARECAEKVVASHSEVDEIDPVARTTARRSSTSPVSSREGLAAAIANGSLFTKT